MHKNITTWTVWFYTKHNCKPQKTTIGFERSIIMRPVNVKEKVGHLIVEEKGGCSRPICLLDSCCVVVGWWSHFFPLFGLCVVLLALPGELGTRQVSYEWASFLFWLFLPVFWKFVNLWWWYEALKAKFLGSWVMESSMLYCTLITMVWIEIFFTKLFWGFQGF